MEETKRLHPIWSMVDGLVLLIQSIASVGFALLIRELLPVKYWNAVLVILLALVLCMAFLLLFLSRKIKKEQRGKKRKILVWLISLMITLGLELGYTAVAKGLDTLDEITKGTYQSHVISLIVQKDSAYTTVSDLNEKNVGILQGFDDANTQKALQQIAQEEEVSITTTGYASVVELANGLLNGDVEAILLNEAYISIMDEVNPDFAEEIRVIHQYEILEEIVKGEEPETTTGENVEAPEESTEAVVEEPFDVTKDAFHIFISGIDTYGSVSSVSRSDVNMIVTVNPATKQILMTSIPRDYYVRLATKNAEDKLTHAGVFGVTESVMTLENLFGIDIDYYVKVNFTSLITIVDAVGGITVNNPYAFTSRHTKTYYPVGLIQMDGASALEFVRERYALPGGDNDRVKNQQRVLAALIEKVISPTIITNYSGILSAVSGSFVTNLSAEEIQSLIQMQLNDMTPWSMQQISVIGTGSKSASCYSMPGYSVYVMLPNYESVAIAANKIREVESGQ